MARKLHAITATSASPASTLGVEVGASTLQRYTYQAAYGVILYASVRRGTNDYIAIYCEHHEDLLCEKEGGVFDAYQVKTSSQRWTVLSRGFVKAISRFVQLDARFPQRIESFYFVSDREDLIVPTTRSEKRQASDLNGFREKIQECKTPEDIPDPYRAKFDELRNTIEKRHGLACETTQLFKVLSRLDLQAGPHSTAVEAVILAEHISKIPECRDHPRDWGSVAKYWLERFMAASRHANDDPDRHVLGVRDRAFDDHAIGQRRIDCRLSMRTTESVGYAISEGPEQVSSTELVPSILRVVVLPVGLRQPRPVNLLTMTGLSRRAAVVIVTGIDAQRLLKQLRAVEGMVKRAGRSSFAPRVWALDSRPNWPSQLGGAGLIWSPEGNLPTKLDLARALAGGFFSSAAACGNVLLITLPFGADAIADAIVTDISAASPTPAGAVVDEIPIYQWSSDQIAAGTGDPALLRVLANLDRANATDRNPDVRLACGMRLGLGPAALALWRDASGEALRLHDMSMVRQNSANHPNALDDARAVALINEASVSPNLRYSLPFLPVSETIIGALAEAPGGVRAVVGLLTAGEMQSRRPRWSVPTAQGYAPLRAASNCRGV